MQRRTVIARDFLVKAHSILAFEARGAASASIGNPFDADAVTELYGGAFCAGTKLVDDTHTLVTAYLSRLCREGN